MAIVFFRYRRYLENQVVELKEENKMMRERYDSLLSSVVPLLRKKVLSSSPSAPPEMNKEVTNPGHKKKTQTDTYFECSCGFSAESDDPAELQGKVAKHFFAISPAKVRSWPALRRTLEDQSSEESA